MLYDKIIWDFRHTIQDEGYMRFKALNPLAKVYQEKNSNATILYWFCGSCIIWDIIFVNYFTFNVPDIMHTTCIV